jgi:hypothetical protein
VRKKNERYLDAVRKHRQKGMEMKSNKELTMDEFMVSHFCKLAMNALQNHNDLDQAVRYLKIAIMQIHE